MKSTTWKTAPISPTCQWLVEGPDTENFCDCATSAATRLEQAGGWFALCAHHGQSIRNAVNTDILIASGERWEGL